MKSARQKLIDAATARGYVARFVAAEDPDCEDDMVEFGVYHAQLGPGYFTLVEELEDETFRWLAEAGELAPVLAAIADLPSGSAD